MIGYRFSIIRLINAVKVVKQRSLHTILALALMLSGVVYYSDAFAQSDQPGPGFLAGSASGQADSDTNVCFNEYKSNWQGVFFIATSKSTESAGSSDFFYPKIRVRWSGWGWIPFTPNYYLIGSNTADLGHSECSRIIGIRFCARYAAPKGTQALDGTILEEDQYGYDPGRCACRPTCGGTSTVENSPCCDATDFADPNNTCCENPANTAFFEGGAACNDPATNAAERKKSCVSPLRFKIKNVTRLCAYEDAWDLADTDNSNSPFHKLDPVCAKYEDPDAQEECIKQAAGNYALMAIGMAGPGALIVATAYTGPFGLIVLGIAAAIGALIAVFTGGAMNYDVMTTSVGTSLGCVDVPMAPPPPVYYYTLPNPPPWPQVVAVSDDPASFSSDISKYPATLTSPITDPGHPENWRYEENKDWFYPKIGVILGDTELSLQPDGSEKYAVSTKRATRVLTGDFYRESDVHANPAQIWTAGKDRYTALPDLLHAEGGDKRQLTNSTLSIDLEQDDGTVTNIQYKVVTEVYNDSVCAYVTDANYTFGGKTPGADGPELIGCVKRPEHYYAMYTDPSSPSKFAQGDLLNGVPYPQIFHPWYNPAATGYPTSLTPYDSNYNANEFASTYQEPKFYWWLTHDPRQVLNPTVTSGYDTYEEYRANDTPASKDFKDTMLQKVVIPQVGCDSPTSVKNPVSQLDPQWTVSYDDAEALDYFKREVNRNHRVHGAVYCVDNYDKNKNNKIDVEDSDLCAQFIGEGKTLEKLERPGATPSGYVGVTFNGKVRIPDPYPRQTITVTPPGLTGVEAIDQTYTTFTGTVVDANGDINLLPSALDTVGNYKNGIRFYSADAAIGCNKKLVVSTGNIETDTCKQENVPGLGVVYYRDPPDPMRGEMVRVINGKTMLVRRKYGTSAVEADTYPTKLTKTPYTTGETVAGECPLVLQADGLTFTPQMPSGGCCAASASGCADPSKWIAPGAREYTIPDILRGETVRKSDQYEEGINKGYCVEVPPSGCPAQVVNGADGTHVWKWYPTFANYTSDPNAIGLGIGEGECMAGYGAAKITSGSGLSATYSTTEGQYGERPLRMCNKGNLNFNAEGKWGNIIRACLPLYCPAITNATFFDKDRDCLGDLCTTHYFACEWAKTQSLYWAEAADIGDGAGHCGDCAGASGARYTEWRVKYCDERGQWKTYTCAGSAGWPQSPTTTSDCVGGNIGDSNGSPSTLCSDGY